MEVGIAFVFLCFGYALCYFVMRQSVRIIQVTLQTVLESGKPKPVVRATVKPQPATDEQPDIPDGPREPTMVIPEQLRSALIPPDINKLRSDAMMRGEAAVKAREKMHRIADEMGVN